MRHGSIPQQKITVTHSGTDYSFDSETVMFDVALRENAVSSLQMVSNDYKSKAFLARCDVGDNVKVEFRFKDVTTNYTQLFGGWVEDVKPSISSQGELLTATALGYGIALKNMLVRQQYGTQSENSTLNKIKEVLTDATYGIIPKYVNKVMASATDSGYSINTTKVADLTSDFRHLYFPGNPAINSLGEMIDLIRAANVPNAGCHWTVVPSGTTAYLCLATVANHENPPADVWPTWWNTNQAGSTIEVSEDMVVAGFSKQRSEANYVLFVGNFRRPANGDKWTENNSTEWDCDENGVLANDGDAGDYVWGSYSVSFTKSTSNGKCWYPKTGTLDLDLTKIGTKKIIPMLNFYIMKQNLGAAPHLMVHLMNDNTHTDYYSRTIDSHVADDDKWYNISLPIGPYYSTIQKDNKEWLENSGNEVWTNIDHIGFCIVGGETAKIWFDGLHIDGMVTRAAYDSGLYSSQKCKMNFIRDNMPKDDSLIATDDSGQMAQICKAELYRAVTEPTVGQIMIPLQPEMKAGQLAHIHFGKKSDGSFRIDENMRIMEVRHRSAPRPHGARSYVTLTDDLKNSRPRQPTDAYNDLMQAVAPAFRDRLKSSLVAGDIDLTQDILAKSYST